MVLDGTRLLTHGDSEQVRVRREELAKQDILLLKEQVKPSDRHGLLSTVLLACQLRTLPREE